MRSPLVPNNIKNVLFFSLLVCDFSTDPDHKILLEVHFKPLRQSTKCEMKLILTVGELNVLKSGEEDNNLR